MSPPVTDHLHSHATSTLDIFDLDRGFRLQLQAMLRRAMSAMYDDIARNIDVAAMRKRGLASVVSFVDLAAAATPLAVGAAIDADGETRLCELSGVGPGNPGARMGLEVRQDFRSLPGTGDPRRYRETVTGAEPVSCGSVRMLLTLVRPFAPAAERLVSETPDELAHLAAHTLTPPHPAAEDLTRVSDDFAVCGLSGDGEGHGGIDGVWGLHHTDTNQYTFTGGYLSALEDLAVRQTHAAGLAAAEHRVHRVQALLRKPFAAGEPYHARGTLHTRAGDTVLVAGIHTLDSDGAPFRHPAVLGRIEGTLPASEPLQNA
ncbi:hypothetical protein [Haliangium sp.]|uniref:hypothetical protein n=1 Tax=Haliangium sp. TaxID=2663208 RepID=UPI003D0B9AF1